MAEDRQQELDRDFLKAVRLRDMLSAEDLIAAGARFDAREEGHRADTALHIAASARNARACAWLIGLGLSLDTPNKAGQTPLMLAAAEAVLFEDSAECLKQLLRHDRDINFANPQDGMTALMMAAALGNAATAQVLADHGADLNLRNRRGKTAFALAAEDGCLPVLEVLAQAGADPLIADNDFKTPAMLSSGDDAAGRFVRTYEKEYRARQEAAAKDAFAAAVIRSLNEGTGAKIIIAKPLALKPLPAARRL